MPTPEETQAAADAAKESPEAEAEEHVEESSNAEQLKTQLQESLRREKQLRAESKERRLKLEAFELAEIERKKSELSELDRLKLETEQATAKAEKAEQELASERAAIAAEKSFVAVVTKLNIAFANEKAREHVFKQMDIAAPDGYEEAVKKIMTDEPYYFKAVEIPDLDAKDKGRFREGFSKEEIAKIKKQTGRYSSV